MSHEFSRRELLTLATGGVLATGGAVTGGALLAGQVQAGGVAVQASGVGGHAALDFNPALRLLSSRDGAYTPARGASVMQFGFDFPEASVQVDSLLFGFRVQTFENVYAIDPAMTRVTRTAEGVSMVAGGLLGCGGQVKVPGNLTVRFSRSDTGGVQWQARAEVNNLPVKSITSVVRGLPRGVLSVSCGKFQDTKDDERIFEYPQLFGGMSTPLVMLKAADGRLFELAARQESVRPARFFFQPGPDGYRVELIHEQEGWARSTTVTTCLWRVGRVASYEAAAGAHFAHVERVYGIQPWRTRPDVPSWMRDIRLVVAIHGAHWTGFIYNDYARMLEILRWVSSQIDPRQVLVFLPAWDGRYYWNYPQYEPDPRMGGAAGFARLVTEAQHLGFRIAPMFGANSANRNSAGFSQFADACTEHIDGDAFDLNWVDWDNDRRNEGWMPFMNLGVPSWRRWLGERIAAVIRQFHVDAYFLDIAGAWENNRKGDMYLGTRELISDIHKQYPNVPPIGEMLYDAQMAVIPMSQVTRYAQYPPGQDGYVRSFQHLSRPAPGRGSTGVHEAGFGDYEPKIAADQRAIPTLTVVDDTFTKYRQAMADYIAGAKSWSPP